MIVRDGKADAIVCDVRSSRMRRINGVPSCTFIIRVLSNNADLFCRKLTRFAIPRTLSTGCSACLVIPTRDLQYVPVNALLHSRKHLATRWQRLYGIHGETTHMDEHGIGTTSRAQGDAATPVARETHASSATESHPVLPKPQGGAGSHAISTDSSDPDVLRQHLERARERLTFYESFDRIIGENIRRSGELMLETISLREEAQERDRVVAQLEAERNAARAAEHDRNRALLGGLLAEAERALAGLTVLRTKLADALASTAAIADTSAVTSLSNEGKTTPDLTHTAGAEDITPDVTPIPGTTDSANDTGLSENESLAGSAAIATAEPAVENTANVEIAAAKEAAVASSGETAAPAFTADTAIAVTNDGAKAASVSAPRMIDVLVHGVSRAPVALSLQNYLKALAGINAVETREFAEGVLRLNVKTSGPSPLTVADLAGWQDGGTITPLSEQESVLELSLSNDTEL